jgi:hypothetical protein
VTIYLCDPGRVGPGIGAMWLAGGGGSWDFRLADAPWGGPVSALSTEAEAASDTTTVVWIQV